MSKSAQLAQPLLVDLMARLLLGACRTTSFPISSELATTASLSLMRAPSFLATLKKALPAATACRMTFSLVAPLMPREVSSM
eukprot:6876531-Pyramimonas_sp.AAC.1